MSEATTLYDDVLYRWEQLPAGTDWPVLAEAVLGQPDLAPYAYYFHEFGTVLAHLPADRDDESLYRQDVVTRFVYWLAGEYGIHEQWPPVEQPYQPEQPYQSEPPYQSEQPYQAHQSEQPYQSGPPYPSDPYAAYGQPDQYGQPTPYGPPDAYAPPDAYPQADPYAPYVGPAAYTPAAEPVPYDQYAAYDLHPRYAEQPQSQAESAPETPPQGAQGAEEAVPVDPAALGLLVEAVRAAAGDSEGDGTLTEEHVRLIRAHGLALETDLDELPPQSAA